MNLQGECMTCQPVPTTAETCVPVCGTVLCEAPGVLYVSIDPDVWKIRCRQCQEKTEHKCALKKLKGKFRGDPTKRRAPKPPPEMPRRKSKGFGDRYGDGDRDGDGGGGGGAGGSRGRNRGRNRDGDDEFGQRGTTMPTPEEPPPDGFCPCSDRPRNVLPRPHICLCEVYKPLNFLFELEVTGEFKPAYVPKNKKGK